MMETRPILTAILSLALAPFVTRAAEQTSEPPVVLTVKRVNMTTKGAWPFLEITVNLRARRAVLLFDSFHNNCEYSVRFDTAGFKRVSPLVDLDSASEERDWVRLDAETGRDFTVSQGGMRFTEKQPKTAVVKMRGRFRMGDDWRVYELVSSPFKMDREPEPPAGSDGRPAPQP